jgi:hypothetical protein
MRGHFYGCAMVPQEVRRRARDARDATAKLIKQSQQAVDPADVRMREAEAAMAVPRDTMRRITWGR